jgi:hypothetical protein
MEILVPKISADQDMTSHYTGVIAYGTGADGKAYVLKAYPDAPDTALLFVILRAENTETLEIFKPDDEHGDGLVFTWYDEAITGFEYFLSEYCLYYNS